MVLKNTNTIIVSMLASTPQNLQSSFCFVVMKIVQLVYFYLSVIIRVCTDINITISFLCEVSFFLVLSFPISFHKEKCDKEVKAYI